MTYMQPYELDAWLGDTELTDEQRSALLAGIELDDGPTQPADATQPTPVVATATPAAVRHRPPATRSS